MRWIYPLLLRRWDGGAVKIDGTISEGDEVAGFRVIHFPGHAPGLIGLWRESDRLAIVTDVVYFDRLGAPARPCPTARPASPIRPGAGITPRQGNRCASWRPWNQRSSAPGTRSHCAATNLRETLERAADK